MRAATSRNSSSSRGSVGFSHPFSGGISTGLWTTSARALSGTVRDSRNAFEHSAVSADGGVGFLDGGRITDGAGREAGRSDESCGGRPESLDDRPCEDHGGDLTRYVVKGSEGVEARTVEHVREGRRRGGGSTVLDRGERSPHANKCVANRTQSLGDG